MTTRITLAFLTMFFPLFAISQRYSSIVTDTEIHNFLQDLNKSKTICIHKLVPTVFAWTDIPISTIDTAKSEFPFNIINKDSENYDIFAATFSQEDVEYLRQQYFSTKDTAWDFKSLKRFVIADSTVNKEIVRKSVSGKHKIKDNYSYTFSVPLFSMDKKSVIIYQDYFCGMLCSTSCVYLYKKNEKGVWRKIASWNCWAS